MAYRVLTQAMKFKALYGESTQAFLNQRCERKFHEVWKTLDPVVPFFEGEVFSAKAIKHHWGVIPIIVISLVGLTTEMLYIIRNACTRDDVQYTKNPPACEILETRKGYPVPIRKFRTYNQKYEIPPALLEAKQGNVDGPETGKKKK